MPAFSPDGRRVAFTSDRADLVAGDTNAKTDVFVKDLRSGAIQRSSTSASGAQGNDWSETPRFSPDGSKVMFTSASNNLVPGDTNGVSDIFVKDLASGAITRVSVPSGGL